MLVEVLNEQRLGAALMQSNAKNDEPEEKTFASRVCTEDILFAIGLR